MNNNKNNNYSFSTWIFVLISCVFIVSIGYKSKSNSQLSKIHEKSIVNKVEKEQKINIAKLNPNEYSKINENNNTNNKITKLDGYNLDDDNSNNISVNKIVVSKNIDNDEESNTYRNPIDAFKTITTLDETVVKEIDYQPSFFIWTSINTEDIFLMNANEEFNPINLSMTVKCKNKLIQKLDYNITANTPRWREWIKIDLANIKPDFINEIWNVEIVDNRSNNILESRNFKLVKEEKMLVEN